MELTKLAELLHKNEKEVADHRLLPRMYLYLSKERLNQRFSFYFFDGVSKVHISKEKSGEAGLEVNWFVVKFGGKGGASGGKSVEINIHDIDEWNKALLVEYYMKEKSLILDPLKEIFSKKWANFSLHMVITIVEKEKVWRIRSCIC